MTEGKQSETKHLSDLLELEKLYLSRTISLKDGTYGFLFTKSGGSANSEPSYQCHPCNIKISGRAKFLEHVNDANHVSTMEKGIFSRENFTRVLDFAGQKDSATYITPGEPLPPGMEGIVELPTCEIQKSLDEHEEPALIGLEYLVEIVNEVDFHDPTKPNVRVTYLCLLCEKKGTSFNIITHVGSPNHHMNYFRRYFPNIFMPIDKFPKVIENKEGVNSIVRRIAAKVEKKYGRMKPRSVSNSQIMSSDGKFAVMNDINAGPHFKEEPEDVEDWKKFINFKYVLRPEQLPLDYPPSPPPPRPKKRELTPPSLYANRKPTGRFLRKSSPDIVLDKEVDLRANKRPRRDSLSSVSSSGSKDRLNLRDTSPISLDSSPRSPRSKDIYKPHRKRSGSPGGRSSGPRQRRHYSPTRNTRPPVPRRAPYPSRRPAGRSRSRSRDRPRRPPPDTKERPPHRAPHRSRSRSPYRSVGRELPYPHRERREEERRRRRPSPERSQLDSRRQREKYKLDQFKEELARIEIELLDKLKYHEKNPEKHPLYPEEWKLFWNRRYKELQAEGKDPNTHDFKPEWIDFWDKRMKELHDSELLEKKKALKDKLDITSESLRSRSPVSDLKNTWQYLTGSAITDRRSRSRSPRSSNSRRESSPLRREHSARREREPSPRRERDVLPRRERDVLPRRERDLSPRREREPSPRRERDLSPRRERDLSPRREHEEYPDYHHPHMMMGPHGHPFPPRYPGHLMYPGGPGPRFMPRMPLPPPAYLPPHGMVLPPSGKVFTDAPLNIITVLRTLTVLENQLGSLGPKVVSLLSQALSMEKNKPTSSVMLMHDENCVLFETIKEKLRGQLMTGVVERHMVNATRHAIKSVEALLFHAPKIQKPPEEPEHIDKVAIAKQIAAALVAQGRPDVSNEELEVLIDAVIQMAKSQAEATGKEVNTSNILSQLQGGTSNDVAPKEEKPKPTARAQTSTTGLEILQSSYDDDNVKEENMDQLSEQDVKDLLRNFKTLSRKEQLGLITYLSELEAKDPVKVKVYRKYLEIDDPESKKLASNPPDKKSILSKHTSVSSDPIEIPKSSSQFFVTATSGTEPISDESDDENYSIEEVYKAAAAKVEEKEKLENPPPSVRTPTEENSESKSALDVTTMSASQASNILDWIKNNANESTDLFKTLLSGNSKSDLAEQSGSLDSAPEDVPTMNMPSDAVQYSNRNHALQETAPPPPAYINTSALLPASITQPPPPPPSQQPPPPPPPASAMPLYIQPEVVMPHYTPVFPQQASMANYQNPAMMTAPGMTMGATHTSVMGGQFTVSSGANQGPPSEEYENNYDSNDIVDCDNNFSGNDQNSNDNFQDDEYINDYDNYSDNQRYNSQQNYDNGNDFQTQNNDYNNPGMNNYHGDNNARGGRGREYFRGANQRGKSRGGRGNQNHGRGGRGRGKINSGGW